jgi:hypothetical protein
MEASKVDKLLTVLALLFSCLGVVLANFLYTAGGPEVRFLDQFLESIVGGGGGDSSK